MALQANLPSLQRFGYKASAQQVCGCGEVLSVLLQEEKEEGFKDAYRLALGTTYYYDDNWTFRTGIAFDDSPVPAQNRSISIPDQDRFWLSAGTTYAFNKDASVDVGVSYMHGQSVKINEGPYQFESEGKAWLFGTNFNYAF